MQSLLKTTRLFSFFFFKSPVMKLIRLNKTKMLKQVMDSWNVGENFKIGSNLIDFFSQQPY